MAYSVSQLLARAARRYADIAQGATFDLELAQEAHNEILSQIPIVLDTETFSSLVAGTRTYAFAVATLRIWEGTYFRTSSDGDFVTLAQTSESEMNQYRKGWQYRPNNEPRRIYIARSSAGASLMGLDPKPATASSGGYPRVTCTVSRKQTLATSPGGGVVTDLPEIVDEMEVYLAIMWRKFTYHKKPADFKEHFEAAEFYKAKLYDRVQSFATDVLPRFDPPFQFNTRPR